VTLLDACALMASLVEGVGIDTVVLPGESAR
jgi:hypothetical protein